MTDEQASGSKPPHLAGKVIIPDLSGVTEAQTQNVKMMGEVTEDATKAFQKIVSGHQSTLHESLKVLSISMSDASQTAGISSDMVASADIQLKNMENVASRFAETATKMTETTNQSYEKLSQAVAQSIAKIEETAKKFSGG